MSTRTVEVAGRIVGGAVHLFVGSVLALIAALATEIYLPAIAAIWQRGLAPLVAAFGG